MKRVLKSLLAIAAVVILAVSFAGCAKVSGNSYVYSEVQAEIPSDADDVKKAAIELVRAGVEKTFKGATITFNEDGTVDKTLSKWTQDGGKVTVTTAGATTAEYEVKGSSLVQKYETSGYTFKVIYKKK